MAEKKFLGAPFGVQTARFDVSAVHPKNKTPGTFTQTPYCKKSTTHLNTLLGPGRYEVNSGGFSDQAVEERADGPGWARAYEVARMAAMPHLLHKEQWEHNRMLEKKLGPGTYEIKDFLQSSEEKPRSTRGIIQTREPRFKEKLKSKTPGPGTYGEGGVPHAYKEEKQQQSASTVGMLDAGSSQPRSLPMVGSHLGPGSYNYESFTDQAAKKVTSLRGPYDLFSGDRNKPIKTGHLAAPNHTNLGPGHYEIPSFLEQWSKEHKVRHGKFGKVEQYLKQPTERIYCVTLSQNARPQTDPGPGQYDPKEIVKPPQQATKSPGFLSSAQRNDRMATKFFTGNFNPVGAGRYDIQKWEEAQHKNGHHSVFRSKTNKPHAAREKFLQERIRTKDVRLKDRVFLVPPENPSHYLERTKTHMESTTGGLQNSFTGQRSLTVA